MFVPYISGGIGYYSKKGEAEAFGIIMSSSNSAIGFQVLGGFDYPVSSNMSINVETKYVVATIEDVNESGLIIAGGVVCSF